MPMQHIIHSHIVMMWMSTPLIAVFQANKKSTHKIGALFCGNGAAGMCYSNSCHHETQWNHNAKSKSFAWKKNRNTTTYLLRIFCTFWSENDIGACYKNKKAVYLYDDARACGATPTMKQFMLLYYVLKCKYLITFVTILAAL